MFRLSFHPSMITVAAAAVAIAATATSASAQSAPRQGNWQGVHVGGHLGGAIGSAASANTSGVLVGGHIGVNGQFDRVVVGVEADVGATTNGHSGFNSKIRQGVNGSMRGRLGYAFDRVMVYGTGGIAMSNYDYKNATGSISRTRTGSVFGAGAELMLTDNVALRGELLRYDYSKSSYARIGGPTNVRPSSNVLRGGLSYRF